MTDLPVEANAVKCIDCDVTYVDEVECPVDYQHAVDPTYVTQKPLDIDPVGDGDQDYWHFGNHRYEYSGGDIVKEKA